MNSSRLFIQSRSNPRLKEIAKLRESKVRREDHRFLIEGIHEIEVAMGYGYLLDSLYYAVSRQEKLPSWLDSPPRQVSCIALSDPAFDLISGRENPDGLVAVFIQKPELDLAGIAGNSPDLLVLDGLEKPGNFGAIARSAAAFGFSSVMLSGGSLDPYHAHCIRNSRGHSLGLQICREAPSSAPEKLRAHGYCIVVANPEGESQLQKIRFPDKVALVLGSEHDGITPFWHEWTDLSVTISMRPPVDSLNVSVSAAILMQQIHAQRT
jgi:TrmH family RNA methyltransferase